jgi:hypothetical protein
LEILSQKNGFASIIFENKIIKEIGRAALYLITTHMPIAANKK